MKTIIKNIFKATALPACAALALLASTASSEAGLASYFKIGDIQGESVIEGHEGWIDIESLITPIVRETVVDPETGVVSDRGDVVFGDIVIRKKIDKASTILVQAAIEGRVFSGRETKIHVYTEVKGNRVCYLTYELSNARISSYKLHTNADDDTTYEEITLGYTKVEWTYFTVDPKTGAKIGEPVIVTSDFASTGE